MLLLLSRRFASLICVIWVSCAVCSVSTQGMPPQIKVRDLMALSQSGNYRGSDYDLTDEQPYPRPLHGISHFPRQQLQEETIDNLLGFVKGVILCGGEGWCGSKCCTPSSQTPAVSSTSSSTRRRKQRTCYPVCQPACTRKCIQAAKVLMQTKSSPGTELSLTGTGGDDGLVSSIPLCRPACMPKCEETCLKQKHRPMKVTCRPACMPDCTPTCVASPPLMVPCMNPGTATPSITSDHLCSCPPGYAQCSQFTCCMRYRTMAVRYRKMLPGYLYADNATETSATDGSLSSRLNSTLQSAGSLFKSLLRPSNQTTVYLSTANGTTRMDAAVAEADALIDYEVEYAYDERTDANSPKNVLVGDEDAEDSAAD